MLYVWLYKGFRFIALALTIEMEYGGHWPYV